MPEFYQKIAEVILIGYKDLAYDAISYKRTYEFSVILTVKQISDHYTLRLSFDLS